MIIGSDNKNLASRPLAGLCVIALCFAGAAFGQEPINPNLAPENLPQWLNEAMARESGDFEAQAFSLPDREFQSMLRGRSLSAPQQTELGWYVGADIDAITPMECWIFTSPVDMAATLRNISNLNLSASARIHGDVIDRTVYFVDAGVIGNRATMGIYMLYAMQGESGTQTGFAKVRIARLDDIHVACSHNQIGFRDTFSSNFDLLVQSAQFEKSRLQPFYRQVMRQSIDGLSLGILEQSMSIDEDGDLAIQNRDSMLVPADDSTLNGFDSYETSFWTTDFRFINQREIGASNGTVNYNLNLQGGTDTRYRVVGSSGEQNVDFGIDSDTAIMSGAERLLEIQRLLADPDRDSLTAAVWQVEIDPNRIVDTTISFESGDKESRVATVTSEASRAKVRLDTWGNIVHTAIESDFGQFEIERVHAEGTPPSLDSWPDAASSQR